MTPSLRRSIQFVAALFVAAVLFVALGAPSGHAQSFDAGQRREIERIIRDYLIRNPEVLQEVIEELEKKRDNGKEAEQKAMIAKVATTLFNSPRQVLLGNPQGDVTLVEFFDYNCGYCARALVDLLELLKSDPKLKVALREFPVLGKGSVEAAQVAAAVRLQDVNGKMYLEFHKAMLLRRGQADRARALATADALGLDMARLERDMAGAEVKATIDESAKLAKALGMDGTPSYVIGNSIVVGAVGLASLREKVNIARCGEPNC